MASPNKKAKYFGNNSKNYHKMNNKKQYIEVGQRGFLATCNFREKDCVRESYNILNDYADQLYGSQKDTKSENTEGNGSNTEADDIADELQKEIAAAKKTQEKAKNAVKPRFQMVESGANNCIFIRTTLPDPVELGTYIMDDIARTRVQKSRNLIRLIPIEVVCRANPVDISNAVTLLFDKYFCTEGTTYAICVNKRYNNNINRDDIIKQLAALMFLKNSRNTVNLKNPAKTILLEVIKGLCCISVLDNYLQYKKYNLIELAVANKKESDGEDVAEKKAEQKDKIESDRAVLNADPPTIVEAVINVDAEKQIERGDAGKNADPPNKLEAETVEHDAISAEEMLLN